MESSPGFSDQPVMEGRTTGNPEKLTCPRDLCAQKFHPPPCVSLEITAFLDRMSGILLFKSCAAIQPDIRTRLLKSS